MYTEEEYEDRKSWSDDMEFMDRYMDELDHILDAQIQRHNKELEENERTKYNHTISRRQRDYSCGGEVRR